jgi:error-prone DNA polymerase
MRLPAVAAGDVHMHRRSRRRLQDLADRDPPRLHGGQAGARLFPNGERHLRSRTDALARLYPPELLAASVGLAERCQFDLGQLRYEYPAELVPAGPRRRRAPARAEPCRCACALAWKRLIAELRYEHFFLTVHDVVAFARSRGILCQGRGSAANSAVCYALGITEVDPARMSCCSSASSAASATSRPTSTSTSSTSGARR